MISTKVLTGVDMVVSQSDFEMIRRGVVKGSLNWPNGLFDELYEKEGHRGVNHPNGLSDLRVSREDVAEWGERAIKAP